MPLSSVFAVEHTATDDLKFRLVSGTLWVSSANIHVETHPAKYGNAEKQDAVITIVDVSFFDDFNLADMYFKNAGAGNDTTIRIVGILMTEARMKELGVII